MIFHKKFTNIFSKNAYFFPFWTFRVYSCRFGKCEVTDFTILYIKRRFKIGEIEHFAMLKREKKEPIRDKNPSSALLFLVIFSQIREQNPKRPPSRCLPQ